MSFQKPAEQEAQKELADRYRPVGLRAVLAAAMMLNTKPAPSKETLKKVA